MKFGRITRYIIIQGFLMDTKGLKPYAQAVSVYNVKGYLFLIT